MLTSEAAVERLRASNLRLTPQRRALIEALAGNTAHPSAESVAADVSRRVPGVSLATVYKTLHEFSALGLVRELDLPGSMRFDPNTHEHGHLMCSTCGTVFDIALPEGFGSKLELPTGVNVTRMDVVLTGTCAVCSEGLSRNA